MIIIPAVDIIDGACVRLTKGDFGTRKKYSDNPVEIAEKWKKEGAEWLHVIDLDGARTGELKNLKVVSEIKKRMDIKVQFGGGIRSAGAVKMALDKGADRVILGTRAIEDEKFLESSIRSYKDKVILSLDYGKGGVIFKNGWQTRTATDIFDIIKKLENLGAGQAIITDISKDGTLEGINIGVLTDILGASELRFIIAGGIGSINDIIRLKEIEDMGICGVIVGKALYEGKNRINLKEAIRIGKGNDN